MQWIREGAAKEGAPPGTRDGSAGRDLESIWRRPGSSMSLVRSSPLGRWRTVCARRGKRWSPPKIFLSYLKNSKTLITLRGIGILQTKSGCNLDLSTPYYHVQNHLNIMDNLIPVSKSTTSLAIISSILYNICIQVPNLLKKVLLLLQLKEDMPLSNLENHVFILTKYANIQKIAPSIFISSAHKLTVALIIITLLMTTILGLILVKIQKISKYK